MHTDTYIYIYIYLKKNCRVMPGAWQRKLLRALFIIILFRYKNILQSYFMRQQFGDRHLSLTILR